MVPPGAFLKRLSVLPPPVLNAVVVKTSLLTTLYFPHNKREKLVTNFTILLTAEIGLHYSSALDNVWLQINLQASSFPTADVQVQPVPVDVFEGPDYGDQLLDGQGGGKAGREHGQHHDAAQEVGVEEDLQFEIPKFYLRFKKLFKEKVAKSTSS